MRELLLTLGHNSSAIMIEDGVIKWGYETERLTRVKSDSRFPIPHLRNNNIELGKIDLAHVTHWSPDGLLSSMGAKYWDPSDGLEGVPIHTLNAGGDRSHHDTHMAAAWAYANSEERFPTDGSYGVVVDGFGSLGEHFSVYDLRSGTPKLIERVRGYDTSLGLWYQYATAFMGMKMHEDEYKLLGYEAHVESKRYAEITVYASRTATEWLDAMAMSTYGSSYDPLYDVAALPNVKERIFQRLSKACQDLNIGSVQKFEGRCELALYVQTVLEHVVCIKVDRYRPKNLVLCGGVFLNVKLNKRLMGQAYGVTCAYPLAGDQGNALGLYRMAHPNWRHPTDLCFGQRVLRDVGHVPGLYVVEDDQAAYELMAKHLQRVGYVNLVRGSMEFGPRALCNTSTIARPLVSIVDRINYANNRNTVMPMAPVLTRQRYYQLFESTEKVWMSHRHMIMAMEHKEYPLDEIMGIAHRYKAPYKYQTSRPQVIDRNDTLMNALLDNFGGVLINTSFNYHGVPIVWQMPDVIHSHYAQLERDPNTTTIVIQNA